MATMVTSTKPSVKKSTHSNGSSRFPRPNGKGPGGNGRERRDDDNQDHFSAAKYRVLMWVVLAAIVMMFAALSSAYIVLSGGDEWKPIRVPPIFFLSTAVLLSSSVTFGVARARLRGSSLKGYRSWLAVTVLLGLSFLVTQLLAWRALTDQGVYLASNPHSAFFYLFTSVHGVHLLGGVVGLVVLLLRGPKSPSNLARTDASAGVVSLYWHTMDGLWVWLFLLLLVWR
jgi:cytochrome c oxidase subunit III